MSEDASRPGISPVVRPSRWSRHASPGASVTWGAVTHVGLIRSVNQDCLFVGRFDRTLEPVLTNLMTAASTDWHHQAGYVAIVADGMGGHAGGEVASTTAVSTLLELSLETPDWIMRYDDPALVAEVSRRIESRLRTVDALLSSIGVADSRLAGLGTTVTILAMLPPDALVAHVGDSRAYLCRGSGLSRLTKDHTLTQALADAGLLDAGDVSRHPKRGILTRAVGHGEGELTIEVSRVHVEPGDQVLLCTDGLTDELSDDDIRMALTTSSSAALASQALVDLALDRGGRDNVTAIVGRVSKGRPE